MKRGANSGLVGRDPGLVLGLLALSHALLVEPLLDFLFALASGHVHVSAFS